MSTHRPRDAAGMDDAPGDSVLPVPDDDSWGARLPSSLRDRLDEPLAHASALTRRTLALFPVRVWRHFLQHNGFLLAAGVSYQSLFAIFSALYLVFAIAGIWLGASPGVVDRLVDFVNGYIPGLIANSGGLLTRDQVAAVVSASGSTLSVTGAIALGVVIWTAVGFITFTRRAVRDIFGLPFDRRSYFLLKARDFLAALLFGLALVAGALLGSFATGAIDFILSLFGISQNTAWTQVILRVMSALVAVTINTLALAGLYRLLAGASLHWRTILPGATLGGVGITALQLGAGLLFRYTPTNALLATFAIFIGLLLWFRLNGIVILVAAAWIAVAARDADLPLQKQTDEERATAEHAALLLATRVRLRHAREARASVPWWRARRADRELRDLVAEVERLQSSPPPTSERRSLFE